MPVFSLGRDGHDHARAQDDRFLAFLDIPSAASHADEHLHRLVVDMPVVAATGLEGDVHWTSILGIEGSQIAIACEILGIGTVQLSFRPYTEINIFFHILLRIYSCHCQEQCDDGGNDFHSLFLFLEYQFHCFWVERLHRGEFQTLHHVQRALLILLEVLGLQVLLIGFL